MSALAACADSSTPGDDGGSTSAAGTTTADGSTSIAESSGVADAGTTSSTGEGSSDASSGGATETTTTGSTGFETDNDSGSGDGTGGSDTSGATCGDGLVERGEACDDGNVADGDGCAADCTPELYYRCVGEGPGSCAPIRMLFAWATNDEPAFRAAAAAVTGGAVDYLNLMKGSGGVPTPPLADLEADYDCIFAHPGVWQVDGEGLGAVLADFVDGGGNVVLGIAFDSGPPPAGWSGTPIAAPDYAPVTTNGLDVAPVSYAGDGVTAIHTDVVAYAHNLVDTNVTLQGLGMADGSFTDGTIATAYRPDFKVVYLNGTGQGDYGPTGDWALLVANACAAGYLSH